MDQMGIQYSRDIAKLLEGLKPSLDQFTQSVVRQRRNVGLIQELYYRATGHPSTTQVIQQEIDKIVVSSLLNHMELPHGERDHQDGAK